MWFPLDQKRPRGRPGSRWSDAMVHLFDYQWMQCAAVELKWEMVDSLPLPFQLEGALCKWEER